VIVLYDEEEVVVSVEGTAGNITERKRRKGNPVSTRGSQLRNGAK